jgi:acetolactate synthase-1/2/3 large subunit
MNGADRLCDTLLVNGVDVCFANPGTSEMHFVAAIDRKPEMRCVLGLFEGVVTGAADGYARMADRPAATLLHLGPGLANGLANLHNARRAMMPMVNIVGDHATYHRVHDAPLASDVIGVATPFSHWVRMGESADTISADGAAAIAAALDPPGRIATLVLPADTAWTDPKDPTIHAVPTVAARPGVDATGERLAVSGLNKSDVSERSGGACASDRAISRADSSPERYAPCKKPEYRSWNASPAKWMGPTGARSRAWPIWSALGGIA